MLQAYKKITTVASTAKGSACCDNALTAEARSPDPSARYRLVRTRRLEMKITTVSVLSLSVVVSVLITGCANPLTNTAPSPTPVPINHTSLLNEKIASLPLVESVSPLRRVSDDASGLETYQGTYLVSEVGGREYASTWTLRMTDSNESAKLHYQQLVSQKRGEGYKETEFTHITSTLLGNVTSSWHGVNNHKAAQVMYGYNYELSEWWMLTVTGLPESVLIGAV